MSVWDSRIKTCYCHTCSRHFHALGINRHRAMHRDKHEDCEITYTYGDRRFFKYSDKPEANIKQIKN